MRLPVSLKPQPIFTVTLTLPLIDSTLALLMFGDTARRMSPRLRLTFFSTATTFAASASLRASGGVSSPADGRPGCV